MIKPHNVILTCEVCGWTESAKSGDLLISTQDGAGNCILHHVEHW